MKNSSLILFLLLLTTLIPSNASIGGDKEINIDKYEAEGYVAFVANEKESTDGNSDDEDQDTVLKPDPDIRKCACKGTGKITHKDGHKTDCPYHSKGSVVPADEETVKHSCQCETDTTFCNCVAVHGECFCQKKTTDSIRADKPLIIELGEEGVLPVDKKKESSLSSDENSKQILFFTATWCSPCQTFKAKYIPILKKNGWDISSNKDAHIKIIDVDTQPGVYYNIGNQRPLPLFVLIENGKEVDSFTGLNESLTDSKGVIIPPSTQVTDLWYQTNED